MMARQVIDTTTNNGTYFGDPAKVAFDKINAMTSELYAGNARILDSSMGTDDPQQLGSIDSQTKASVNRFINTTGGTLPPSQSYGVSMTFPYTPAASWQLAGSVTGPELAFRRRTAGVYSAWQRIWHSGNTTVDANNFIKRA